ncbi:MAG: hypothetical protein JJU00_06425 [Opitutales bacterium]|nr:hypothetical protein [Opitutales bacterium]
MTNPAGAPWARPACQIRLRGANDTQLDADNRGSTILQYGGGTVPEGEYEYLHDFGWWVPGFNASALGKGNHPSGNVTPPGEMSLPSTEEAPEIARLWGYYNYFERLEGLRLSWRATSLPRDQVIVDFVRVEVENFETPFAYWIRQYFDAAVVEDPAAMNRFAPEGDASGDGLRNQAAYFFGLEPDRRHDAGAAVHVEFGDDEVVVQYPRSWYAHGLGGGVEWSTNLTDWHRHGIAERRLEDTIDPADTNADVIHRETYCDRPEVVRGAWTMEATLPRPADGAPVFVRIWTEDRPAAD